MTEAIGPAGMQIEQYLARIGLYQPPGPTLEGLAAVIRSQALAVPFENMDVQLGRPVSLDPAVQFRKIVTGRRGGWCFELNGVLGWALASLGFDVVRLSGAVERETRGADAEGNHLMLLVRLDGQPYIADAGFGQGPRDPVPLRPHRFTSAGLPYSLEKLDARWWRLSVLTPGEEVGCDFTTEPADEARLAAQSRYLQSAAESPFVQNAVAMRHLAEGVAVLKGRVLHHVGPPGRRERMIADPQDLLVTLRDVFGLDLPEAVRLWPRLMARHEALFGPDDSA